MATLRKIQLTGVFMKDHNNMITGFFSQFPEAVSQGETVEETEKKLFDILPDVMEMKDRMSEEDIATDENVTRKFYSYEQKAMA